MYKDRAVIAPLIEIHLRRYANMIEVGSRGASHIRIDECMVYHKVWLRIKEKDADWERLTGRERNEVIDALNDEGYEFTSAEIEEIYNAE